MVGDRDALEARGAGYEKLQESATDLTVCRTDGAVMMMPESLIAFVDEVK
jgi:hypothetical protein